MTAPLTPDEADAVGAVVAGLGLGPVDPIVIGRARHVVVRLDPLGLVARLSPLADPAAARAALAREVAVARHLVARRAPVIRPAERVDAGPHQVGRWAMTLWELMPHEFMSHAAVTGGAPAWAAALSLRGFHEALAGYDAALPRFEDMLDACAALLTDGTPALGPDDRAFLVALHGRLRATLDGMGYRPVPIHGDAHLGNALETPAGMVWADLEAVCLGPLEWDIASLPPETWPAFEGADARRLACLSDLRALCVATWCWAQHGRGPEVDAAATHHLDVLHGRFGRSLHGRFGRSLHGRFGRSLHGRSGRS